MEKKKIIYRKTAAFVNREQELRDLKNYISEEPEYILFLHGPRSSGKTTLLYRFLQQVEKEEKLVVKFLNLRKVFTEFDGDYSYRDFLGMFFNVTETDEKKEKLSSSFNVGIFKIDAEIETKMKQGKADPFLVMEQELIRLNKKGRKTILVIDELQALDKIYMNNGKDRRLIIEIFNFFVAMTKESHLAHVIIASSDSYFLNTVYNDSKLKKTSKFYAVDYLGKEDVMDWLLNLEKYSGIKDYALNREEAEKIWDTVGGSMWEIQLILGDLFDKPIDDVLTIYKKNMRSMIAHYIQFDKHKKQVLQVVNEKEVAGYDDFGVLPIDMGELEGILKDMVRNNVLYFDPAGAVYYPQGESYRWGLRLYFSE